MRSVDIPSSWTSVSQAGTTGLPPSWVDYAPPPELTYLLNHVNPPAKLLEILQWSLERPVHANEPVVGTVEDAIVPEQCPETHTESTAETASTPKPSTHAITTRLRTTGSKNDLVSATLSKIAALKATKVAKRPTPDAAPTAAPSTDECTSCFDDIPTRELIRLSCTHYYCKPCLASLVLTALQNENSYPPKCCLTEIPPATIIIPLDRKQREIYKSKAAEYSVAADKRWYCPSPSCSKWIAPAKLRSSQKCPHCHTKICLLCRGLAHNRTSDCPQDQGLEATLNVAEAHGWRRCYRCRTMVERAIGCRHITCNCGAEFCYVCGAKWRSCDCTEVDEARRQAALERQRGAAAARDREEDEELRRALAIVSVIEAREAEELQRRQRDEVSAPTTGRSGCETARRREEEQLARLEQERLQEQERRQQEAEALEKELKEALELSIRLETQSLLDSLIKIIQGQYTKLDDRQGGQEQVLISAFETVEKEHREKDIGLRQKITASLEKKLENINAAHDEMKQKLLTEQETQEDEMFMQIQLHLRGKPNKETREQRLLGELHKQQDLEQSKLEDAFERDLSVARKSAEREAELLKRATELKIAKARSDFERKMGRLVTDVRIERHWFDRVSKRRAQMVGAHSRLIYEELKREIEPVGLTQSMAKAVQPLPESSELGLNGGLYGINTTEPSTAWASANDSLQQTPVELEAPWPLPSNGHAYSPPSSRSSYTTSNYSFVSVQQHEGSNSVPGANTHIDKADLPEALRIGIPTHDSSSRSNPAPDLTFTPRNGPAFVAAKSGESSKPIDIHIPDVSTPPTPPESPHPRPTVMPRRTPGTKATGPSNPTLASSARVPARPATTTVTHAWSFYGPLPSSKPKTKAKKEKAPSLSSVDSRPSATTTNTSTEETDKPKKKPSRWPFRRKEELTPEQIREKMRKLQIGDAF